MMHKKFILWGGTGQARVINEALQRQDDHVAAIVDNSQIEPPLPGIPVLCGKPGLTAWLAESPDDSFYGLVAIGGDRGKDRLTIATQMEELGILPYTLIHQNAFVALDARIGEWSQILALSAICTHVVIGRNVIINTSASVDHDSRIDDGVHIAPGAKIAGEVHVENCAFIGTGAIILPRITIGRGATVGAGAVVTKDVEPMSVVIGNPAHCIKK